MTQLQPPSDDLGQCQARTCMGSDGSIKPVLPGDRCPSEATIADPRGPKLCWVHHKAFNNPNRRPLHLHKSADGIPK